MKKLLILIFTLLSITTFGQYTPNYTKGFQFKGLKADSALYLPTFNGLPDIKGGVFYKNSALAFDSTGNKLYYFNPKDSSWKVANGFTDVIHGADTSSFKLTSSGNKTVRFINHDSIRVKTGIFSIGTVYIDGSSIKIDTIDYAMEYKIYHRGNLSTYIWASLDGAYPIVLRPDGTLDVLSPLNSINFFEKGYLQIGTLTISGGVRTITQASPIPPQDYKVINNDSVITLKLPPLSKNVNYLGTNAENDSLIYFIDTNRYAIKYLSKFIIDSNYLVTTNPYGTTNSYTNAIAGWNAYAYGKLNPKGVAMTAFGVNVLNNYIAAEPTGTLKSADISAFGYNAGANLLYGGNSLLFGNEAGYNRTLINNSVIMGSSAYGNFGSRFSDDSTQDLIGIGTLAFFQSKVNRSIGIGYNVGTGLEKGEKLLILGDISGKYTMGGSLTNTSLLGHNIVTDLDSIVAIGSLSQNIILGNSDSVNLYGFFPSAWYKNKPTTKVTINGDLSVTKIDSVTVPTTNFLSWNSLTGKLQRSANPNYWVKSGSDISYTAGKVNIGDASATSPNLTVLGGSGGSAILSLRRTSGTTAQFDWALAGGGLSFTDVINGGMPLNLFGGTVLRAIVGQYTAGYSYTTPSLIGATTFAASAGSNVNATQLFIQGSLGTGTGTLGDILFNTGDLAASGSTPQSSSTKMILKGNGNFGINTLTPSEKLEVVGNIKGTSFIKTGGTPSQMLMADGSVKTAFQVIDDTSTASSANVGKLRYRVSGNNSYVDICMQTGSSTYEWVNLVQNNW